MSALLVPKRPFAYLIDGKRAKTYAPTRLQAKYVLERLPEREKEVALAQHLGARPAKRVGFWGTIPKRTDTAHFWLPILWEPLPGSDELRFETACGRWDLGRYKHHDGGALPRAVKDITTHRRVCARCAFAVEAEDA